MQFMILCELQNKA